MANEEVELFDLASKGTNTCWSLNPWKTRLILNLKRIPYKTTWLEYPSVAPTLQSLSIPPNTTTSTPNPTPYTIPTIRLPDGTCIMDSKPIAAVLEQRYPDPPLHLDSAIQTELEGLIGEMLAPLRGVMMPKIPRNLLNPESVEYFERTRAERFGCSLAEFERTKGGEGAWMEAEPKIKAVGDLLKKKQQEGGKGKGGPFFMGETVSYADLIVVGALRFFVKMGEGVYERVVGIEPSLGKLYEASAPWLERDTY